MPSQERVIEMDIFDSTVDQGSDVDAGVWKLHVEVLFHTFVMAGLSISSFHAFINSVLVCSPHVINSCVDLFIVDGSSH